MSRALYYGDNLAVLRESIKDESIDLVYLDPPFNSNADYNVLFRAPSGEQSPAQIEAFVDTWHWNDSAERDFDAVAESRSQDAANLLIAMRKFLGDNDMMAYLAMMAVRLIELRRVLKDTGSLYLHCDPTASHYLKLLLDSVFGPRQFRSEISWKRSSAHNDARQGRVQYGNIRDTIFFYTKSEKWTWHWQYTGYSTEYVEKFYRFTEPGTNRRFRLSDLTAAKPGGDVSYEFMGTRPYQGRYWAYSKENMEKFHAENRLMFPKSGGAPAYKRYLDEMPGVPLQNDWDDLRPVTGNESLGYPTQKPVRLLERIIAASSNPGDVVLDPFCGCGTATYAAEKLGRQWIGIDITHLAISLIERRLKDAFPSLQFDVHGTPKDFGGARDLAARDKYQFQWWAVSLVDAQPYQGRKKGADGGIDGLIFFKEDKKTTRRVLVSVKGGENVSVAMIRDLKGVLEREKEPLGLFLSLEKPTQPMLTEAANAGFYELHGKKIPKIQIATIEDLLEGKHPLLPGTIDTGAAFKAAPREDEEADQGDMFDK